MRNNASSAALDFVLGVLLCTFAGVMIGIAMIVVFAAGWVVGSFVWFCIVHVMGWLA